MSEFSIYIDGASRGNPGPSGTGVLILDDKGKTLSELATFIGFATNNVAEYSALIHALDEAKRLAGSRLSIFSDSELLVRQMNGEYKIKHPDIKSLAIQAHGKLRDFEGWTLRHIPREKNKEADRLSNVAVNRGEMGG